MALYWHNAFDLKETEEKNDRSWELKPWKKFKHTLKLYGDANFISYNSTVISSVVSNCGMVLLYLAYYKDDYDDVISMCKKMGYSMIIMTLSDDQDEKEKFILDKGFVKSIESVTKNKRSGNTISTYFLKI